MISWVKNVLVPFLFNLLFEFRHHVELMLLYHS
jgi:hypothetical protein